MADEDSELNKNVMEYVVSWFEKTLDYFLNIFARSGSVSIENYFVEIPLNQFLACVKFHQRREKLKLTQISWSRSSLWFYPLGEFGLSLQLTKILLIYLDKHAKKHTRAMPLNFRSWRQRKLLCTHVIFITWRQRWR